MPCRTMSRGEAAREDIVADTGNEDVVLKLMDLSSLQSVRDFADDFNASMCFDRQQDLVALAT